MTVKIDTSETKVVLDSPYHPDLPTKAKALGGKFDGRSRNWSFDIRDLDRVRAMALEVYGTDGTPQETVTVRMRVDNGASNPLWVCGRKVAQRYTRDRSVYLGDGVVILDGAFQKSGGSRNYPTLSPDGAVILEIRDVPRPLAEADSRVEIVGADKIELSALQARREALLAELAEIDARIASLA